MDNNVSYGGFAPVNYYGVGDDSNSIINTNITSLIEEINVIYHKIYSKR